MKVDCIKTEVNFKKIMWAIDCFKAAHVGLKPSYVIMNYETRADLMDRYYYTTSIEHYDNKVDTIFGIPVAINEGLKFGEVDIV